MRGKGVEFLNELFESLKKQTFRDFDVVISDHSKDTKIKELCLTWQKLNNFTLHYIPNAENRGSFSANTNNAMRHAKGILIKILFMDDFFYSKKSLEQIAKNFDIEKDHWLVTGCVHTKDLVHFYDSMYPTYNHAIHHGTNTIGCPSVLTILNDGHLLLDNTLLWLNDCDYYKRYYTAFGPPRIVNELNVVNRIGAHQVSNTLANDILKEKEYEYILQKYGEKMKLTRKLKVVFKRVIKRII